MAVETETQLEAWLAENVPSEPNLQTKTGIQITQNGQFSFTPDAGYDGLASVSGTVVVQPSPTKAAQTYTPTTTDQVIAANQWLAGAQTIKGDANLVAGNIKDGVSIFGVTGSYSDLTVETINGTFRNPWGNKDPSYLMAQANLGNLSLKIFDPDAKDYYYNLKNKNSLQFSMVSNFDASTVSGVSVNSLCVLLYDPPDGRFLAWGTGSSISDFDEYADEPCTLTIIYHPLPSGT